MDFFWIFLHFFCILLIFWGFFKVFWNFSDFFLLLLLMLLLKVTKVITGDQKMPRMGQNSIISSFFAPRAKKASAEGRSPPQELEVSPHSGLYLLVYLVFLFFLVLWFLWWWSRQRGQLNKSICRCKKTIQNLRKNSPIP